MARVFLLFYAFLFFFQSSLCLHEAGVSILLARFAVDSTPEGVGMMPFCLAPVVWFCLRHSSHCMRVFVLFFFFHFLFTFFLESCDYCLRSKILLAAHAMAYKKPPTTPGKRRTPQVPLVWNQPHISPPTRNPSLAKKID